VPSLVAAFKEITAEGCGEFEELNIYYFSTKSTIQSSKIETPH
jgi:hypothetical protein